MHIPRWRSTTATPSTTSFRSHSRASLWRSLRPQRQAIKKRRMRTKSQGMRTMTPRSTRRPTARRQTGTTTLRLPTPSPPSRSSSPSELSFRDQPPRIQLSFKATHTHLFFSLHATPNTLFDHKFTRGVLKSANVLNDASAAEPTKQASNFPILSLSSLVFLSPLLSSSHPQP